MKGDKLSPRQKLFVAEYLKSLNATEAAVKAGYSAKTAHSSGPRMLTDAYPAVKAAIAAGAGERLEKLELEGDHVIKELHSLGFSNVKKLFDAKGALLDVRQLDDDTAAAIASIELECGTEKKELDDGDVEVPCAKVLKVKFWDKPKSLELLGKYFKLWAERVVHTTDPDAEKLTLEELRAAARE